MANRITQRDLENQVISLNNRLSLEGKYGTIGAYTLSYAYGGVQLHQWCNEHGGVRTISTGGYGTKRELYNFMQGMLST
jgi:hypothetical protein